MHKKKRKIAIFRTVREKIVDSMKPLQQNSIFGLVRRSLILFIPVVYLSPALPSVASFRHFRSPVATMSHSLSPPVANKVEHKMELFGDVRIDNYYWLRDDSRKNSDVISYLQQENAYTDFVMSGEL